MILITAIAVSLLAPSLSTDIDPRGPIQNVGMRVEVAPGSVQAPGYRFENHCQKPDAWAASWIGLDDAAQAKPTAILFRKTVHLPATPSNVKAWISADVFYRLYINGKLVSRGPADMGRDYDREERGPRWMYDFRDLSGSLKAGDNVIAAEIFTEGFATSKVSRDKHGLLFEAKALVPGHPPETIKSDGSWRVVADAAWHGSGEYDAAKEKVGWRSSDYDDSQWPHAAVLQSVWTPLVASEIPPLMEARYPPESVRIGNLSLAPHGGKFTPLEVTAESPTVELKFDRVMAAYPTLKIDGVAGVMVRIVPGEREGQQSRVCTLKLREGIQTYEYPALDSFSVLKLEFSNIGVGQKIKLLDAGAVFSSTPVEYAGSFECSDPHLNELWKTCRWLVQICMQTHHLDSPNHQEPICDPGDYLIESHANNYAFGTPWLARQDLRKFGLMLRDLHYRNFHTSYSLLWLQMLLTYYDYSGDASLVKELSPEVHALLDTFTAWRGKNGLISEAPNYMFMDWVTIAGFECHHPPAVIGQGYMTAFYYRGLLDGIRVAKLSGDMGRVKKYEGLRKNVFEAFNRELWVKEKGLYRDGKPFQSSVKSADWLPADKDIETFSPHVNTLAVLYDLVPANPTAKTLEDRMKSDTFTTVLANTLDNGPLNCEPYFTYFVLEALAHADRIQHQAMMRVNEFGDRAPELIKRWKIESDTKTFHEMWTEGDLSHAWGSGPMIQMSSTILGVRPAAPGFDRILICPDTFGLKWANGVVPTPHGPIKVNWTRGNWQFILEAEIPRGIRAEVQLSPGSGAPPMFWGPGKHKTVIQYLPGR